MQELWQMGPTEYYEEFIGPQIKYCGSYLNDKPQLQKSNSNHNRKLNNTWLALYNSIIQQALTDGKPVSQNVLLKLERYKQGKA